jgi:peptidoglycan/LPS O-acetylase OafA/YrhL
LRTESFAAVVTDLVMIGLLVEAYRRRARRSLLLLALTCALWFTYTVLGWIAQTESPVFWGFLRLVGIGGSALWLAGMYRLLADLRRLDERDPAGSAAARAGEAAPREDGTTDPA